jgi:hypothetical protein
MAWFWEEPGWNADALTQQVLDAHAAGLVEFRRWTWGRMKPYNGFEHETRVRAWQIQCAAMQLGLFEKPEQCAVCRGWFGTGIDLHNEDYARPFACYPMCKGCHLSLHRRFSFPAQWLKRVAIYRYPGAWFVGLTMERAA